MNWGQSGIAALVGAGITAAPLFVFVESRIVKRVKQEVEVTQLRERQKAASDSRALLEGRVWTLENEVKRLGLEHARAANGAH